MTFSLRQIGPVRVPSVHINFAFEYSLRLRGAR